MKQQPREHWGSKLGFILAAIGSAIGLGVLWKFPYVVGQNGGGLFLLAYIICIVIIGVPVLIGELLIGRESQRAAVGAFQVLSRRSESWRIAGWFGVASSFLIMSFYSVVAGWGMSYILMSLMGFSKGLTAGGVSAIFEKLYRSGGICIFWHFLFTILTMGMVLAGVRKGIEKWAKIMTRALFVILIVLLFYCINLDGFGKAVQFIFAPNTEQFHFSSVLEALGLAFFTLSLGQGIMISYGSYMKRDANIPQMAGIVSLSLIIVSILAALTIFPVVFTFGFTPTEGPGLVFKTLPYLFAQLPGTLLFSSIFFILFVFTAFTSAIPFIEVVATNLMELLGWRRKKAVLLVALGTFLFGIPSALAGSGLLFPKWQSIYGDNFLNWLDQFVSNWLIPIGGLLTTIFIGWILERDAMYAAFKKGSWVGKLWRFGMRWLVPLLILLIILQKSGLIDFDALLK